MSDRRSVTMIVNGQSYTREVETRLTLADFIRHEINLTGTHLGCEHGVCGACTVRINGKAVRSCLSLAVQSDGHKIDTLDGMTDRDDKLGDLQEAFRKHHALQCGYCTPGVLMSLDDYLERVPDPSEDDIRDMLSGHLCRCTGYVGMVRAALDVAAQRKAAKA